MRKIFVLLLFGLCIANVSAQNYPNRGHNTYPSRSVRSSSSSQNYTNKMQESNPSRSVSTYEKSNEGNYRINGFYFSIDKKLKTACLIKSLQHTGDISIPNTVSIDGISYSVTQIGENAFKECNRINTIIIPNTVTTIGKFAFSDCRNINKLSIPNSVKVIGDCAFSHCSSLTSIVLPNSITEIGEGLFYMCQKIDNVIIPDGVISIGKSAFFACSNLHSVIIPNSVITIGDAAFAHCVSLESINIPNKNVKISRDAIHQKVKITSMSKAEAENDRNSQRKQSSTTSTYESQEWVDLNLPSKTLWAKNNVGAESIGDIGIFCTWQQSLGIALSQGGAVPTSEQFSELLKYCDWKWTFINGNEGYLVSSKTNPKNNIFLPIAGYYSDNGSRFVGSGFYWTKTRYAGNAGDACYFCFWQGCHGDFRVFYLDYQLSVRLVNK